MERMTRTVTTRLNADELCIRMRRASQDCICESCGKRYGDHPLAEEALDFDDRPFLHMLCDGMIVKL